MTTGIMNKAGMLVPRIGRRLLCQPKPTERRRLWIRNRFRLWCQDREVVVRTPYGFQMLSSPHDYISHRIYFYQEYDAEMSSVICHHVFEGQTVWDVGAERGWFTLLMARVVDASGRVDAFEAFPPTAKKLEANIALNSMPWARASCVAVSDTQGKKWFVPPTLAVQVKCGATIDNGGLGYLAETPTPGALEVPSVTLDEYADRAGVKQLSFIKMDIEGAEVAALRGASDVIRRSNPIIGIEYNQLTAHRAGTSVEELDDLLESHGYQRYVYLQCYRRLNLKAWLDRPDEEIIFNVYCFPRGKVP